MTIGPTWRVLLALIAGLVIGIAVAAATTYSAVSLPGQLSFVTNVAPIALAMGLPIEPLAILIAVETIPDIFRTVGNVTMDVAVAMNARRARDDQTHLPNNHLTRYIAPSSPSSSNSLHTRQILHFVRFKFSTSYAYASGNEPAPAKL